jgi:hypothetical protein
MTMHRVLAQRQAGRDLGVGEALAQQRQHIQLSWRQGRERPIAGYRRAISQAPDQRHDPLRAPPGTQLLEGPPRCLDLTRCGLAPAALGQALGEIQPDASGHERRICRQVDRGFNAADVTEPHQGMGVRVGRDERSTSRAMATCASASGKRPCQASTPAYLPRQTPRSMPMPCRS